MAQDLDHIYSSCLDILKSYESKGFPPYKQSEREYRIASRGDFEVSPGRRMKLMELAAIVKCKNSVAFHFMPVYMNEPLAQKLQPALAKCREGKACFHLKAWTPEIEGALKHALEEGHALYKQRGWVGSTVATA